MSKEVAAPPLKIQYASDLHLEHYPDIRSEADLKPERWIIPDPTADALVLAGDIGFPEKESYHLFLKWCSEHWPQVFVVAGNHEYYNHLNAPYNLVPEQKLHYMRWAAVAMAKHRNIHILNRDAVELRPGVWILGCTLWSDVPDDMHYDAKTSMNDYRLIFTQGEGGPVPLTVKDTNSWHQEDLSWLLATLEEIQDKGHKAIVVTHHLPTFELVNRCYKGHPLNCCFASSLDAAIERFQPLVWICGHSHLANRVTIGRTQLALNPHGYPGESVPTRNKTAVCELGLD